MPELNELRVSLPWNTGNFAPLNGFHPLYAFLLDLPRQNNGIQFVTFETALWYDLLSKRENNEALTSFLKTCREKLGPDTGIEPREFWSFFDFNEALIDELSRTEIKLIHTTPVWAGQKPFIYHLESFETAFYPWRMADPFLLNTPTTKLRRIKSFLSRIFDSSNCLAIVSHVPRTLERFKTFFELAKSHR